MKLKQPHTGFFAQKKGKRILSTSMVMHVMPKSDTFVNKTKKRGREKRKEKDTSLSCCKYFFEKHRSFQKMISRTEHIIKEIRPLCRFQFRKHTDIKRRAQTR